MNAGAATSRASLVLGGPGAEPSESFRHPVPAEPLRERDEERDR